MSFLVVAVALLSLLSSSLSWPLGSARTTVTHLPWFDGPLQFHLETGYVEVDEGKDAHMFYYFVKSERSPESDPLIVWHSGGPGCSGVSAMFLEFGPVSIDFAAYNEGRSCFVKNPYAWTQTSNIIFVDAPMGTGFSYAKSSLSDEMSDSKSAHLLSIFVEKWLISHPEFLTNPLYIGGDSYAGKIVPLTTQELVNGNQDGNKVLLNLKGYMIGNSPTDSRFDGSQIRFAHGMGLISDEVYEAVNKCDETGNGTDASKDEHCVKTKARALKCIGVVNWAHILEPTCPSTLHKERPLPKCRTSGYFLTELWSNDNTVREALGVRKGTVKDWKRCKLSPTYAYDVRTTVKYHLNLTTNGYRALVYSGDHDMIVPFVGTQASIRSLNYSIVSQWRPWFVDSQVVGFTETFSNNLTYATVKGGGHAAAEYRPKECQAMFNRWISNSPL